MRPRPVRALARPSVVATLILGLASCTTSGSAASVGSHSRISRHSHLGMPPALAPTASTAAPPPTRSASGMGTAEPPLPTPRPLVPFGGQSVPGEGVWQATGRPVGGSPAVYETTLTPPGGTQPAGIAWMDTHLLAARLYSGSVSPGGGPYQYTAPIQPAEAATLVAAFNGGFMMNVAGGGYFTEGRTIVPLVAGAASLVITTGGGVDVGAWGTDVTMTPNVVSVRQNLVPLVSNGKPTQQAASSDWQAWGRRVVSHRAPLGSGHRGAVALCGGRHRRRCARLCRRTRTRSIAAGPAARPSSSGEGNATRYQPGLARLRILRSANSGWSRRTFQWHQAGSHDGTRTVDVLRALVGTRLHNDVGPAVIGRVMTMSQSKPL